MSTTFDLTKSSAENIYTMDNVVTKTVDFSKITSISGGDTVKLFEVADKSAIDRYVVVVETACTGISGTLKDEDATSLSSLVNLEPTGATFVSANDYFTTGKRIDLVTSGTGAIATGKVSVQAVYSIVKE